MKSICFLLFTLVAVSNSFAQATFQKTYGGDGYVKMTGLARAYDGGYVSAGGEGTFGDTTGSIFVIKTDTTGKLLWSMIYEGYVNDYCNKVIETADHGFLLIGQTYSFGSGGEDAFLTKIDSAGNIEWSKAYGGTQIDFFINAIQTYDGGYIAVGSTTNFGAGAYDMLIVRTNASGDTLWTRILGGTSNDQALDIIQIQDSDFVMTGRTQSFTPGTQAGFLCKLNQSGDTLWTRVFGGTGQDEAIYLQQTYDGGYIVTGSSDSFTPSYDAYLNRFDSTGHLLWSKTYGGPLTDATYNIVIMSDSGFALLGFTNSFGTPNQRTEGDDSSNVWIIRTDANGDTLWSREYGGYLQDESYGLLKTSEDGLVILGFSNSFGSDPSDAYLIRTDAEGHSGCHEKATYPVVLSPTSIVERAPVKISSGVLMAGAPFLQNNTSTITYILCSSVGINQYISSESWVLYPNPATNQLVISTSYLHHNEAVTVSIINILGQEAASYSLSFGEGGGEALDVSKLPSGIYFVQIIGEKERWMGKFVKE